MATYAASCGLYPAQYDEQESAEIEWSHYESWASDRTDADFAEDCRDFLTQLLAATGPVKSEFRSIFSGTHTATVQISGWDEFAKWQFNRWVSLGRPS